MRNLILTGLPRAGTTLACALVDGLDDAVCLSEPDWQDTWSRETDDPRAYAARVHADFGRVRTLLAAGGEVLDRRAANGAAVTNYFRGAADGSHAPAYVLRAFRRPGLGADFLLGMKHNAHYTCALGDLAGHDQFAAIAIVRHPLATIQSWRAATDLPINQGRLPAAERLWPDLARLSDLADTLLRQVGIYRLFCERYLALADRVRVLRYEDIVRDPDAFVRLCGRGRARDVAVAPTPTVEDEATPIILARLREHCAIACRLYPELQDA
ncbi:MAG: sulfotransferase [Proteobacteria bacterium]|nr:sulfotransferase [Pseudomonadota bacterium]